MYRSKLVPLLMLIAEEVKLTLDPLLACLLASAEKQGPLLPWRFTEHAWGLPTACAASWMSLEGAPWTWEMEAAQ